MTERIGVAISTTGDPHRISLLRQCVAAWCEMPVSLFVTVDGTRRDCKRVAEAVQEYTGSVYQVGQPHQFANTYGNPIDIGQPKTVNGRLGVAANKNTGLELLMGNTDCEHLFLCDDDTWPLNSQALALHMDFEYPHSVVAWGGHRLDYDRRSYAAWKWPRGVLLYQNRAVVDRVGGMDERFGIGGHEHVEYSQRIHNAKVFTAERFISPAIYAANNAMGARAFWHAEDMPKPGESLGSLRARKRDLTTIHRGPEDRERMGRVLTETAGRDSYVPYEAALNGRASATLCLIDPSLGAEK